ncbi:MAG: hypothetical protein C0483_01080 [Pirellula sp.]|nr:hypothetical protein [Pirellula sp.]
MKTRSTISAALLVMGAMLSSPVTRSADAVDDKVLASVYHEGLKSFYAGDNRSAHETLSQAIDAGSKDPRCYYIRGFANARLGRMPEAQQDFTKGAELEAQDFDVFYNVSQALERIQGPERRSLETYRTAGRKNALAAVEKIRLEQFQRFDPTAVAAPAANPPAAEVPAAAPAANDASNPFGTQPAAPAMPATPATPPADPSNPFGTSTPPAAAPPAAPPAAAPPSANPFGS